MPALSFGCRLSACAGASTDPRNRHQDHDSMRIERESGCPARRCGCTCLATACSLRSFALQSGASLHNVLRLLADVYQASSKFLLCMSSMGPCRGLTISLPCVCRVGYDSGCLGHGSAGRSASAHSSSTWLDFAKYVRAAFEVMVGEGRRPVVGTGHRRRHASISAGSCSSNSGSSSTCGGRALLSHRDCHRRQGCSAYLYSVRFSQTLEFGRISCTAAFQEGPTTKSAV